MKKKYIFLCSILLLVVNATTMFTATQKKHNDSIMFDMLLIFYCIVDVIVIAYVSFRLIRKQMNK